MLRNRGSNKNNDSRYVSHLSTNKRNKVGDNSIYKSSMLKVLGDYSEDKSDTSEKSKGSTKAIEKKEIPKK